MSNEQDRTEAMHGSTHVGSAAPAANAGDDDGRLADGLDRTSPARAIVEAENLGSSWGWPTEVPRQARARTSEEGTQGAKLASASTSAPVRTEPGEAGSLPLTREHLETWIERLRASHPGDGRQAHPRRDTRDFPGGPRRSVPDRDILFVGRAATAAAPDGADRKELAFGQRSPDPGSPRRTLVLSVVLAAMLIWLAHSSSLFAPRPIEVPTTLNNSTRIT